MDEAKDEVKEIVDFLREPERFSAVGGRIPKGVLLVGPPGTGKTLLARSIAGEAGVPFLFASGSDFVEMYAGVGASRVRKLFREAKRHGSCIIFIDELDAVGRSRGGTSLSHEEREQTLNQLLVEMDGFEGHQGIVIIAATNRQDILDPALLRPGRFDRQVTVGNPDLRGREAILRVHARKINMDPAVDLRSIARGTPGFSGADLANLVNEAALFAGRASRTIVTNADMHEARDKVLMGVERRSVVLSELDRVNCAYHEAGHAVVAALLPKADPLHKVTIIPRGRAMGVTMQLPEADRHTYTKDYLETQVAVLMGGRVAEELFMNHMTSGASNDIERATDIAQHMVCEWGMSELGPLAFRKPGNAYESDRAARRERGDRAARGRADSQGRAGRLRPRQVDHREEPPRRRHDGEGAARGRVAGSRRVEGAARARRRVAELVPEPRAPSPESRLTRVVTRDFVCTATIRAQMGLLSRARDWPVMPEGKYRIEGLLGRGGMGAVYAARDVVLDRPVAIKVIRPELVPDPAARERFLREAQTLARLTHPSIVRVFACGSLPDGGPYLVMELVRGVDLQRELVAEGRLEVSRASRILAAVVCGDGVGAS